MSSESLQVCFKALHCTGELVLTSAFADTAGGDPLRCAWAAAEADAALAYDAWQQTGDGRAFTVYRAAADRADAAQDALAAADRADAAPDALAAAVPARTAV
jgi:hypothetical protein